MVELKVNLIFKGDDPDYIGVIRKVCDAISKLVENGAIADEWDNQNVTEVQVESGGVLMCAYFHIQTKE